jgi:hypothetical protein
MTKSKRKVKFVTTLSAASGPQSLRSQMAAPRPSTISQTAATSLSESHLPSCGSVATDDPPGLASLEKRS